MMINSFGSVEVPVGGLYVGIYFVDQKTFYLFIYLLTYLFFGSENLMEWVKTLFQKKKILE